jgi:hypothetical protein
MLDRVHCAHLKVIQVGGLRASLPARTNLSKEPSFALPVLIANYASFVDTMAGRILEQFRQLPEREQRELAEVIFREATLSHGQSRERRKTIADIAGKYRPDLVTDASALDHAFADAIIATKSERQTR